MERSFQVSKELKKESLRSIEWPELWVLHNDVYAVICFRLLDESELVFSVTRVQHGVIIRKTNCKIGQDCFVCRVESSGLDCNIK